MVTCGAVPMGCEPMCSTPHWTVPAARAIVPTPIPGGMVTKRSPPPLSLKGMCAKTQT